jgi:hypothetical protein
MEPATIRSRFWLAAISGLAAVGLSGRIFAASVLYERLLALALILLLVDQTRMAVVDLRNIQVVRQQSTDPRLATFQRLVTVTIAVELVGFYLAAFWLGWGAIAVLLSQIGLNLAAQIELLPDADVPIRDCGISQRIPILIADCLACGLVTLWMGAIAPTWTSGGLLGMVLIYLSIKYGLRSANLPIKNRKS